MLVSMVAVLVPAGRRLRLWPLLVLGLLGLLPNVGFGELLRIQAGNDALLVEALKMLLVKREELSAMRFSAGSNRRVMNLLAGDTESDNECFRTLVN
jgi:hypothetical protein